MEISMENIKFSAETEDVTTKIAEVLQGEEYLELWRPFPVNLRVTLDEDYRRSRSNEGTGTLTIAVQSVANQFLEKHGGKRGKGLKICGRKVFFRESRREVEQNILDKLKRTPYVDPRKAAEKQKRIEEAKANQIPIRGIEFGWKCRDRVFSCEWEKSLDSPGLLRYDEDGREFRVVYESKSIALRVAQINERQVYSEMDGPLLVIFFSLDSAPIFEETITAPQPDSSSFKRTRTSSLDTDHERVVAHTSLALRLICDPSSSFEAFRTLCGVIPSVTLLGGVPTRKFLQLFSADLEAQFEGWLEQLNFEVAFQLERIVRDTLVNFQEILATKEPVENLVRSQGPEHTARVLRSFHSALKDPKLVTDYKDAPGLLLATAEEYEPEFMEPTNPTPEGTFTCFRVSVTPTAMKFNGPLREKSNRVFRRYPDHHSYFIRVTLEEENRLKLRFDREVDGATFVKKRYGTILRETGLKICGRKYYFLAYSQSSLKDHSVWFMCPFKYEGNLVDPASIISSLGDFRSSRDQDLIRCPGRYGARISQAFTSTDDPGVIIKTGEFREEPDIEAPKNPEAPSEGKYYFTDGVGTISSKLAEDINHAMGPRPQSSRRDSTDPTSYQIRFQGCKGMVIVDPFQRDHKLVLRHSMIKFDAPAWPRIEIVRAFDRPSPFYLNRPLIMVLEHLGVEYRVFKEFQDKAVRTTEESRKDFECAGKLLESFGLGASFCLPSVMFHLHKLEVPMQKDPFYERLMDSAINHVLRDLKHQARIPFPGQTLVGVADVHQCLEENEVFACFVNQQTKELEYLEGEMVITRSPVNHPGDVQIVKAIGRPPSGSPFEKQPLANTVVFSTRGVRPVPSKLGGGDLDGDLYNITSRLDLPLKKIHEPAAYHDAPKKLLDRECTMGDVADFVTEYINSDVVGIISTNWLIIADQSIESVLDKDCETLSSLHSRAVDYPKSSTPVPLGEIPKLKFKAKPDWSRPETMSESESADYYKSTTAVGRLFRAIQLPAQKGAQEASRAQHKKLRAKKDGENDRVLTKFGRMKIRDEGDAVDIAVSAQITKFIAKEVEVGYGTRASSIFNGYAAELKTICAAYTISRSRDAMLTEEEAVVGTIVAKTSNPRLRADTMWKLREQMDLQVKSVRNEVISEEDEFKTRLKKAWALWRVTQEEGELMGARSLGLIALGVIFDTIREHEEKMSMKGYR